MAAGFDNTNGYVSLLGIADAFLKSDPPRIRHCIHCLEAVFKYQLPPHLEAHLRVQLGMILLKYTQNVDLARSHLERSVAIIQSTKWITLHIKFGYIANGVMFTSQLGPGFEEILCQSVMHLIDIFKSQNQPQTVIPFIELGLKFTQNPIHQCLHYQLLFQLAEIHASLNDFPNAIQVLLAGEQFSHQNGSEYMRCLFILSRILYLIVMKEFNQASLMLNQIAPYLEMWQGPNIQVEHTKIFYLALQVWLGIALGQPKTVKPYVKQLQHLIKVVSSQSVDPREEAKIPEHEQFRWLSRDHLCIIVYLLTVIHCAQGGHMEKSLKYSQKALHHIASLHETQPCYLLSLFELILLENVIVCHVVVGHSNKAIKEVASVFQVCNRHPKLQTTQSSMVHTLLGLYAMSMNQMEHAEFQFKIALKSCRDTEQYSFISLNLCIVYIRMGESRRVKLEELIQSFSDPQRASLRSSNIQAGYYYILGLKSFFESKYHDARRHLRETLKVSNSEESYRLTACALVLLGHTFLKNGNLKEALDMVKPGMQLADKMPDAYIQLWAASLLRDLYHRVGDQKREAEAFQMHSGFTKKLLNSHGEAIHCPEHKLVEWRTGPTNPGAFRGESSRAVSGHQGTPRATILGHQGTSHAAVGAVQGSSYATIGQQGTPQGTVGGHQGISHAPGMTGHQGTLHGMVGGHQGIPHASGMTGHQGTPHGMVGGHQMTPHATVGGHQGSPHAAGMRGHQGTPRGTVGGHQGSPRTSGGRP